MAPMTGPFRRLLVVAFVGGPLLLTDDRRL